MNSSSARRDYLAYGWFMLASIICLASVWGHLLIGLNNDHKTLLDQSAKLLAGWKPYIDFIDTTPPLILIFYFIPIGISHLFQLPMPISLAFMTLALIAISGALICKVLTYSTLAPKSRWIALSSVLLALLLASFIHQPFADREHLMLVLIAPWLVMSSPRARRDDMHIGVRIFIGLLAAMGFAIKPFFYIFYILPVCYQLFLKRNIQILFTQVEEWVIIIFAVCHAIGCMVFFPAFFSVVLPLGWQTYEAISWSSGDKWRVIGDLLSSYALPGLLGLCMLAFLPMGKKDGLIGYLLVLLLASLINYRLNGGWYYTQYPFIAISLVFVIAVAARLIESARRTTRRDRRLVSVMMIAGASLASLYIFYAVPAYERGMLDVQLQLERGHVLSTSEPAEAAQKRLDRYLGLYPDFTLFSTNLWGVNLLREGTPRRQVGLFDYLWPLPGIVAQEGKPQQRESYEALALWISTRVAQSLQERKPQVVVVDTSPYQRSLPPRYDILGFFQKNYLFRTAWKEYALVERIDACTPQISADCSYAFYRLQPASGK